MGKCCELSQLGLGWSHTQNLIWSILALKMRSGGNSFDYFLENKLTNLLNLVQFKRMFMSCLED